MKPISKYFGKRAFLYLATAFFFSILIDPVKSQTTSRDHRINETSRDHRINEEEALKAIDIFKEWVIGANQSGLIDGVLNITAPLKSHYSIKGLENRKFLQRKSGVQSDIDWTSNASAETEKNESNWVFYPKARRVEDIGKGYSVRSMPILYGEAIAIVWQPFARNVNKTPQRENLKYSKHRGRSNLRLRTSELTYDWVILGGKTGTPVKRRDRVVLFNLTRRQPLIYHPRKDRAEIGWPDSISPRKGQPFYDSIKRTQISNEIWSKLLQ